MGSTQPSRMPSCDSLPCRTPGEIWCGAERCQAPAQLCRVNSNAEEILGCETVIPQDVDYCKQGMGMEFYGCDDRSDCPSGQVCCRTEYSNRLCLVCQKPPCNKAEACLPKGECSQGFRCVAMTDHHGHGTCRYNTSRGVPCGAGLSCRGEMSICCWDEQAQKGRCIRGDITSLGIDACGRAYHFGSKGASTIECTADVHCGPRYSCYADPLTFPRSWCERAPANCVAGGAFQSFTVFCRSTADCPIASDLNNPKCEHVAGFPPGTKLCRYTQ